MIKRYCDICSKEVERDVSPSRDIRLKPGEHGRVRGLVFDYMLGGHRADVICDNCVGGLLREAADAFEELIKYRAEREAQQRAQRQTPRLVQ